MQNDLGQFQKGYMPWNKGTKGICQSNKTSFKIGHKWSEEIEQKRLKNSIVKMIITPNLSSTNELAYLLGLIHGDGFISKNIKNNGYIIGFDNTQKLVIDESIKLFKSVGLNPNLQIIKPYNGISKRDRYRVLCYSKMFYEFYKSLNLNSLKKILDDNAKILLFIRGFYEAEGCLYHSKNNCFYIKITNTNLELMKLIDYYLKENGLNFKFYGPKESKGLGKKPYYELITGKKQHIEQFFKLTNPCIKRLEI